MHCNTYRSVLISLKSLGADISEELYSEEEACIYITAVKTFIRSKDFMRLGQAVSHRQWQAAAKKAADMSAEAKRLGLTRFERPLTGIRQNINRKNSQEALQILAGIVNIRVQFLDLLGIK